MKKEKTTTSGIQNVDLTKTPIVAINQLQDIFSKIHSLEKPLFSGIELGKVKSPLKEDVAGGVDEPIFDFKKQKNIQGNVLPGFNKDFQQFLFYNFRKSDDARAFLKWLLPYISSMEEVMEFRKRYRIKRLELGKGRVFLCSTWVNIAFSAKAIAKLTSISEVNKFGDLSFKQGLAERSTYLGDPTKKASRGHTNKWVVGGPKNEADIIVIIASDSPFMLEDLSTMVQKRADKTSLKLIYKQDGATLPTPLRGHEHFGFKDGISQPGVRGRLSAAPGDYITPRYINNSDERRHLFAKPGQQLVWPGQFVVGEKRQSSEDLTVPITKATKFPKWAAGGSYLVVRRLHQDVQKFWSFATKASKQLGISPTKFATMLVGRWPSGAPILRSPATDNTALAVDEFANNHFLFDDNTRPSQLRTIPGYVGDSFSQARADFLATVCPHFAHIRKMNTRDSVTDLGKPEDNMIRMILRRGIPYGPPVMGIKKPSKSLLKKDRGLMFLCYGTSIEDQFEFLQRRWANSKSQPNVGGHDPIIGQNGSTSSRVREIEIPTGAGKKVIKFKDEWVVPTGGGYFFAPGIDTIKRVFL